MLVGQKSYTVEVYGKYFVNKLYIYIQYIKPIYTHSGQLYSIYDMMGMAEMMDGLLCIHYIITYTVIYVHSII